jgi:amidase
MSATFEEYDRFDALGLAELVRTGKVSARELVNEAISRVDQRNPTLNAVITRLDDSARAAVEQGLPDGPFKGVPFLVKDLGPAIAGVRQTMGSRALSQYVPTEDSVYIKRARASGLVPIGTTNTPEFGITAYTEPRFTGITRNPWSSSHTVGGSSGGSACAVAAGLVPMAHGNDGGGSIRVPSSCCGLCGLKPSRGRPPAFGGCPGPGDIAVDHVLTRSVRDSAAMLDATSDRCLGAPPGGFLAALSSPTPRLRIAVCRSSLLGKNIHAEAMKALDYSAELLHDLGHVVEEARPDGFDVAAVGHAFAVLFVATTGREAASTKMRRGGVPPRKADMEPMSRFAAAYSRVLRGRVLVDAITEVGRLSNLMSRFHERYEVLLTPTLAAPPVPVGSLKPKPVEIMAMELCCALGTPAAFDAVINALASTAFEWVAFTPIANMTGQPSISLPLYWTSDGLPVGTLLTAGVGREDTLLGVAAELERESPWFDRRPERVTNNLAE